MAFTVAGRNIEAPRPTSVEDLKSAFEKAVREIHHAADPGAKKSLHYRSPIVPRARVLGISQASAEKRALADAARALAQLWKV
jgi:hypothetical protein